MMGELILDGNHVVEINGWSDYSSQRNTNISKRKRCIFPRKLHFAAGRSNSVHLYHSVHTCLPQTAIVGWGLKRWGQGVVTGEPEHSCRWIAESWVSGQRLGLLLGLVRGCGSDCYTAASIDCTHMNWTFFFFCLFLLRKERVLYTNIIQELHEKAWESMRYKKSTAIVWLFTHT